MIFGMDVSYMTTTARYANSTGFYGHSPMIFYYVIATLHSSMRDVCTFVQNQTKKLQFKRCLQGVDLTRM